MTETMKESIHIRSYVKQLLFTPKFQSNYQTWGKWLIHAATHHKDNQLHILECLWKLEPVVQEKCPSI